MSATSEDPGPGRGPVAKSLAGVPLLLVGIRVIVLALVLIGAGRGRVSDVVVLRAERVATSPAAPYRAFPVGTMPLETLADGVLAGGGPGAAAARIAIVAFPADLATAWALAWGWGRRPAIVYLLLGLPLLSFLYLRFDLVAVALATWGVAWTRHRGEALGGVALGLATMAKLWPIVLLPIVWMRRTRRAGVTGFAVVVLLVGAWWYLTGGPKGPFQVLTFQGARGWHVQGTIGSVLWLLGRGIPVREFDLLRTGDAATWAKTLLFLGLLGCELAIWRRAAEQVRDPAGGAALAAVSATIVFAPQFSVQYAAWLLPWAALAFEGDEVEGRTATIAAIAITVTGVIAIAWPDPAMVPSAWLKLVVMARNALMIGVLVSWLARRTAGAPRGDQATATTAGA